MAGLWLILRMTYPTAVELCHHKMKRLLRIFELSKNEQRVVLLVMLMLVAIGFIGYERRMHRPSVQPTSTTEAKPSPSPVEAEDEQ
jgi:hypothetical protein